MGHSLSSDTMFPKILTSVYHAIFGSHLRYACQVWGLRDSSVTHRVLTLQNTAMRLMTFNGPRTSATPLYRWEF